MNNRKLKNRHCKSGFIFFIVVFFLNCISGGMKAVETLYLSALPERPAGGFIEISIFDGKDNKPVEIGKPVYRFINVYKTGQSEKYAN